MTNNDQFKNVFFSFIGHIKEQYFTLYDSTKIKKLQKFISTFYTFYEVHILNSDSNSQIIQNYMKNYLKRNTLILLPANTIYPIK